jgi:hypothetical protein
VATPDEIREVRERVQEKRNRLAQLEADRLNQAASVSGDITVVSLEREEAALDAAITAVEAAPEPVSVQRTFAERQAEQEAIVSAEQAQGEAEADPEKVAAEADARAEAEAAEQAEANAAAVDAATEQAADAVVAQPGVSPEVAPIPDAAAPPPAPTSGRSARKEK